MSIKTTYISYLKSTKERSEKAREKIVNICISDKYTESEKRRQSEEILIELSKNLSTIKDLVEKDAKIKIESLDKEEQEALKRKNSNIEYQMSLNAAMLTLPLVLENVSTEDLKKRLVIFEDDPIAIEALRKAANIDPANFELVGKLDEILPENMRGKRQNTIRSITNMVKGLIEEMQIKVGENAYSATNAPETLKVDISYPALIGYTIDYITACNDDCTVYYPEKHEQVYTEKITPNGLFSGYNIVNKPFAHN